MNISAVIPVYDDAGPLSRLLERLCAQSGLAEIIVVDGGSADDSIETAGRYGATVLQSGRGRGQQLAHGAERAGGDILWFVHADCLPDPAAADAILRVLSANPAAIGGNFRLVFDGETGFSCWLTGFYGWLRRRGIYYGDSGIFVRRDVYHALGGIAPISLMEDFNFVRRLERAGRTLCIERPALVTSSRRFAGRKPWRIVWGWIRIHALYFLGVSPEKLTKLYDKAP